MSSITDALKAKHPEATGDTIAEVIRTMDASGGDFDPISAFLTPAFETNSVTFEYDATVPPTGVSEGRNRMGLFIPFSEEFNDDIGNEFILYGVKMYKDGTLVGELPDTSLKHAHADDSEIEQVTQLLPTENTDFAVLTLVRETDGFAAYGYYEISDGNHHIIEVPSTTVYYVKPFTHALAQLILSDD